MPPAPTSTLPTSPRHTRKRESAVATAAQIQKLVAAIPRQWRPHTARPDDAAARALGYQLATALVTFQAVCLDETFLQSVREQVLGLWCGQDHGPRTTDTTNNHRPPISTLHPSVAAALFQHLTRAYQQDDKEDHLLDWHWLAGWILRLEEASIRGRRRPDLKATLGHALQTYQATILPHQVTAQQFLQLYQRLQLPSTRWQLIQLAGGAPPSSDIWAALWALAASDDQSHHTAAWVILPQSSRILRNYKDNHPPPVHLLDGWTSALLWSLSLSIHDDDDNNNKHSTLWWSWWEELRQLGQWWWETTRKNFDHDNHNATHAAFTTWWQRLWNDVLPVLLTATHGTTTQPPEVFVGPNTPQLPLSFLPQSPTSALAWVSWFLSSQDDKQAAYQFWHSSASASPSPTVQALLRNVTLCLMSDPLWQVSLADLPLPQSAIGLDLVVPLLPSFLTPSQCTELWKDLLHRQSPDNADCLAQTTKYTPMQQSVALLCGLLLLETTPADGFGYLTSLIRAYPHLSITLMPVIIALLKLGGWFWLSDELDSCLSPFKHYAHAGDYCSPQARRMVLAI